MVTVTLIVLASLAGAVFAGLIAFGLLSIAEHEGRAARVSFALAASVPIPLLVGAALAPAGRLAALAGVIFLSLAVGIAGAVPLGKPAVPSGRPARRVDERDVMFARARLRPGSPEFEAYYAMRPENRALDDRTRALPGLLSPRAPKADPTEFGAAQAAFEITEALRDRVDGPVADGRLERSAIEWMELVRRVALGWGAKSVGVTELRPYHVYTHVGRGTGRYGDPIRLDHRYAVAFSVEMDHAVMQSAPEAPVVAESARQYVESAKIAIQLANLIRGLGYPARAHIDGNYRVIAPLVALDAGIGEIGRIGLVMTPRLGPRVRLGVVTTDLPLEADQSGDDPSVLDFCTVCKKCAVNCPPGAIPFGDREPMEEGARRWRIDSDACFRYWNAVGTDCGRCMAVCPYSHPDNPAHDLVRRAIRRSAVARRAMIWLDDLFYGRKPRSR